MDAVEEEGSSSVRSSSTSGRRSGASTKPSTSDSSGGIARYSMNVYAVFNATGTRVRDLPITPDKLLDLEWRPAPTVAP